jgi:hypothetical protein
VIVDLTTSTLFWLCSTAKEFLDSLTRLGTAGPRLHRSSQRLPQEKVWHTANALDPGDATLVGMTLIDDELQNTWTVGCVGAFSRNLQLFLRIRSKDRFWNNSKATDFENGRSPTLAAWRTGAGIAPVANPQQRRPFPGLQGDDAGNVAATRPSPSSLCGNKGRRTRPRDG